MSEYGTQILLKFYDSLNTDMVHATTFLEHLTTREFISAATSLSLKNDLIPYLYHKMLDKLE